MSADTPRSLGASIAKPNVMWVISPFGNGNATPTALRVDAATYRCSYRRIPSSIQIWAAIPFRHIYALVPRRAPNLWCYKLVTSGVPEQSTCLPGLARLVRLSVWVFY